MVRLTLIGILFLFSPIVAMDPLRESNETESSKSLCQLLAEKVMATAVVVSEFADDKGICQDLREIKEGLAANMSKLHETLSRVLYDNEKESESPDEQIPVERDEEEALSAQIAHLNTIIADQKAIIEALQENNPQEKQPN